MNRPPAGPGGTVRPPAPIRPPVLPQQTAPVRPLHGDRPFPDPPPARDDRRAIRDAVRARRRMEAGERRRTDLVARPRLVVGVLTGVLVLLVGLPLLLAFGPVFPVRTIAVSGASGALAGQVRQALAGELGRPVAVVDDQDVAAALRTVPAVERFTLVRRPPSTLEIAVVPRTPVAQQRTAAGWAVLDAARVTIEVRPTRTSGLPAVTLPGASAHPGAAYAAAVSALQALSGADPVVTEVSATSPDDVVLTLAGGIQVRWGGAEDGAAKAEALRAALVRAAAGASEIDVSSPGVVQTR
jgi:cell division protein FtsQ